MLGLFEVGDGWVGEVVGLAALVTALWVLWRKFFRPLGRLAKVTQETLEAIPTLLDVAETFKPNGGKTLYDQVSSLNTQVGSVLGKFTEFAEDSKDDRARLWSQVGILTMMMTDFQKRLASIEGTNEQEGDTT